LPTCQTFKTKSLPTNSTSEDGQHSSERGIHSKIKRNFLEDSDDEESSAEIFDCDQDEAKRISSSSKVNFSKLSNKEKEMRCVNMSRSIKKLRRRSRILKNRCSTLKRVTRLYKTPRFLQQQGCLQLPRDNFSFPQVNEIPPTDGEALCIVKDIVGASSNTFQSAVLSILSRVIEGKNCNDGNVF